MSTKPSAFVSFQHLYLGKDMVQTKKSVLDSLLNGQLQASTTIISDSLVQPALLLFRELIETRLLRDEHVYLVCAEIDGNRFAESLCHAGNQDKLANLHVLDCNLDLDTDALSNSKSGLDFQAFDIDDVAGLSKKLQGLDSGDSKATIFFDSINALETFNSDSAVLRMFRQCKHPVICVHHIDVMTTANVDERISKSPLLPLLLAASGSRSSIHLTMHPCSILAHLHYVYGIENVGQRRQLQLSQEDDDELDTRVYRYLSLLYARGWGNPLMRNDDDDDDNSGITRDDEESYGGREYDNPSSSKVVLDLLGCSSKVHGSAAGRCVVEYALRGVNKSNKRSDVSKIARGLEGLRRREEMDQKGLSATRISEVLRIKGRALKRTGAIAERETSAASEDPFSSSMFNLGLTDRQREEKERVELPFTRGGGEANGSGAIIIYEPDSADDLDESDPDEDLEL